MSVTPEGSRDPRKLVIIGAGGHARVVADAVAVAGTFHIAGFLDGLNPQRKGEAFCGTFVLGAPEDLDALRRTGVDAAFVAVGECAARLDLDARCAAAGFERPVVRHPSAVVAADATVGSGGFLAAGSIIGPGTTLGRAVIVNTAATVDHDSTIGDGVHVAPGAHLGGRVIVGAGTWIGIGATIRDGIRIGGGCLIGAGAVVVEDLEDGVVAYGNPARVVRRAAGG